MHRMIFVAAAALLASAAGAIYFLMGGVDADPEAYAVRGAAHFDRSEYDQAIADFGSAIRLDSRSARHHVKRGDSYNGKGDYERAIADYSAAIALDPKDAATYERRSAAYMGKGDTDRANADYAEMVRLDAEECETDRNGGAVAACSRAIVRDPADAAAWYNRGLFSKDQDRAESDFEQAMKAGLGGEDNRAVSGHVAPARIHDCTPLSYRGIAGCTLSIVLDPRDVAAYVIRGAAWLRRGEHGRAVADYEAALKLDPNNAEAREGRERAQAALAARPEPGPAE
jgi:tetratricopeptide (TPR) repeat protein